MAANKKINFNDIKILYNSFDEYFNNTIPEECPEHPWYFLPDATKAVEKIFEYKNRKILIVADYDADGTNSCAIVKLGLNYLGFSNVDYVVPWRFSEGYGITTKLIDRILSIKPDLIITVDNGITAIDQIQTLLDNNIEIIVTDHHEPRVGGFLPNAYAVVDQKREDSKYPFREICGAYVAFKLIQGCFEYAGIDFPREKFVPYATAATIADVMPLVNENRTLVKEGLNLISNNPSFLYRAFFNIFSRINQHDLKASDFAFYFGPLINCESRMTEKTDRVMNLFLNSDDKLLCDKLASELYNLNEQRKLQQNQQDKIIFSAVDHFYPNIETHKVPIVAAAENLHRGIIGINASHVSETVGAPAIILSVDPGTGIAHGSARSINQISALEMLNDSKELLLTYGGHQGAAGLSLKSSDIKEFRQNLIDYSEKNLTQEDYRIITEIACQLKEDEVTLDNYHKISSREPYGVENEEPLFYGEFDLTSYTVLGGGSTLKMTFGSDNRAIFSGIMFKVDQKTIDLMENGAKYRLIFTLNHNFFQGKDSVQIQVNTIEKLN